METGHACATNGCGFMDFKWNISAYRPRLSGHQHFDMLTDFTKKKKKLLSMQHFWGVQHIGDSFLGIKKKKKKKLHFKETTKIKIKQVFHII